MKKHKSSQLDHFRPTHTSWINALLNEARLSTKTSKIRFMLISVVTGPIIEETWNKLSLVLCNQIMDNIDSLIEADKE